MGGGIDRFRGTRLGAHPTIIVAEESLARCNDWDAIFQRSCWLLSRMSKGNPPFRKSNSILLTSPPGRRAGGNQTGRSGCANAADQQSAPWKSTRRKIARHLRNAIELG